MLLDNPFEFDSIPVSCQQQKDKEALRVSATPELKRHGHVCRFVQQSSVFGAVNQQVFTI